MALTGTDRGSGGNTTTATTLAISPTSDFTPGTLAVLCAGWDNSGSGGADPYTSITDNAGNRWTSLENINRDPGAANAGCSARMFTAYIGKLLTTDVITITFNTTTVSKAWTIMELAAAPGFTVEPGAHSSTTAAATTAAVTTGTTTIGFLLVGMAVFASNGAMTADSDTNGGTWSTAQTASAGNATSASNIETISQRKVVTSTVAQQYGPTVPVSADNAASRSFFIETAIPGFPFTRSMVRS